MLVKKSKFTVLFMFMVSHFSAFESNCTFLTISNALPYLSLKSDTKIKKSQIPVKPALKSAADLRKSPKYQCRSAVCSGVCKCVLFCH